jgi:hypothetical protein
MKGRLRHILTAIGYLALGYFTWLMLLITLQYVPVRYDVAFLLVKEAAIAHTHYKVAFFSHVYTSILVLILGATQLSSTIRRRFPAMHRRVGKGYVVLILLVASPSGLLMALYANGGAATQLSFALQAVLWFTFTLMALIHVKRGNWISHRNFMWRSYALTLSAISLRLFKWIIVSTLAWPPMDTYRLVAWLGWMVNLAVVERLLWHSKGRGGQPTPPSREGEVT